jgi:hypothetical protein
MAAGKIFCVALGGFVVAAALLDVFSPANLRTITINGFDDVEVGGKYSHIHRRALTDFGPLRFPNDNEWGSYDDRAAMRKQLKAGCRYQLMVSHEAKDHQTALGRYTFTLRANRTLDVGRIDKVVRLIGCTG